MTLTETLATILSRPVASTDRERAALHLVDWIGCAAAGLASAPGVIMRRWAAAQPEGSCLALGAGGRGAGSAALANGSLGNVLEMDDLDRAAVLHPGPVVIPAALAAAQRHGASGHAMLDAIVRGYEAAIRVGRSVGPGHYRFWHNTATCSPFGAAAAAGSILALRRDALADALGNAGTLASGLWQMRHEASMAKQLHCGRAAQAGLEAAELAALGFTGPRAILEGPQGFYAATCPDARPEEVTAGHAGWLIHATSFKPWPACRHAHPTIDATLAARASLGPVEVASARVETFNEALTFCDKPAPRSEIEAKFSLQHCVAVICERGSPGFEDFRGGALDDAALARLRSKVAVVASEPFAGAFPSHYGARVTLVAADGRRATAETRDALGDPELPLPRRRIEAKAVALLAEGGLAAEAAQAIIRAALGLAQGAPLAPLLAALEAVT